MIHSTAKIAPTVKLYGHTDLLSVGPNTRIDDFTILSVGLEGLSIGKNVHISNSVFLSGYSGRIHIGNYCFVASRSCLLTATDDMSADCLVGPQVDLQYRKILSGPITLEDASGVATGSIIFPNVIIGFGAVVGALSICKKDVPEGYVIGGTNHRVLKIRNVEKIRELIKQESITK